MITIQDLKIVMNAIHYVASPPWQAYIDDENYWTVTVDPDKTMQYTNELMVTLTFKHNNDLTMFLLKHSDWIQKENNNYELYDWVHRAVVNPNNIV